MKGRSFFRPNCHMLFPVAVLYDVQCSCRACRCSAGLMVVDSSSSGCSFLTFCPFSCPFCLLPTPLIHPPPASFSVSTGNCAFPCLLGSCLVFAHKLQLPTPTVAFLPLSTTTTLNTSVVASYCVHLCSHRTSDRFGIATF